MSGKVEEGQLETPELLIDGSFESASVGNNTWTRQAAVGGWRSDSQIEVWGKNFYGLKATDGNKMAELDFDTKASNIYQDVQTEKGTEYTFSFDYMKRPDSKMGSDTILVYWNNELVGKVEPSKSDWSNASFKVTGTGGTDRIEFREESADNDSYGGLVDNASLKRSGPTLAEREAEAAEKAKDDHDHEHDGNGHGDGDHNDDGHSDNGQSGEHGAGQGDDEGGPLDPAVLDTLSLQTSDIIDFDAGQNVLGDKNGNGLSGGRGNDEVAGKDGDDELHGDANGWVTVPLDIQVDLVDENASEKLSIRVSNLPDGAVLSAGIANDDGSWTLTADDLQGLSITGPDSGDFTLSVEAFTEGESNLVAQSQISVSLVGGQDDVVIGGKGNDALWGDAGNDVMYGGSRPTGVVNPHQSTYLDDDVLHGGAGNDQMWGNSGDDEMFGEADDDTMFGGKGNDLVDGGEGNDALSGNTGDDTLVGGAGDDRLFGNSGNDTLDDGDGNDEVLGSSGDDRVIAGQGDDSYVGGSGYDTIDFSGAKQGMTIDLSKKSAEGMGSDFVSSFEHVIGSSFDDVMKGSKRADALTGGDGNDVLRGLGGEDVLTGGKGNDTFTWQLKDLIDGDKHLGVDHVTDFEVGDSLDLHGILKGRAENLVVADGDAGTTVSVDVGGSIIDVAVLDGVHGLSGAEMLKAGMILA